MADEIGDSLNLAPLDVEVYQKPSLPAKGSGDEIDRDYTYARENFYGVIESGTRALEHMLELARQSQHPRAYEVVSTIMKTLLDANKDLVDLANKKKEKDGAEGKAPSTVNNNLFVGSTADLQKMLKDLRNGDS